MKWALLLATGVIAGLAWRWYAREDDQIVSQSWRDDQRQREATEGDLRTLLPWKWPIEKEQRGWMDD